jgi:hypothetical protein
MFDMARLSGVSISINAGSRTDAPSLRFFTIHASAGYIKALDRGRLIESDARVCQSFAIAVNTGGRQEVSNILGTGDGSEVLFVSFEATMTLALSFALWLSASTRCDNLRNTPRFGITMRVTVVQRKLLTRVGYPCNIRQSIAD